MEWSIREAGIADVKALALVGAATFLETFAEVHTAGEITAHCEAEHDTSTYEAFFQTGSDVWLIETVTTGAPVGYAVLTEPDLPSQQLGDLELKRIYTLSRLHGSGAGLALLNASIARAEERGAHRLLLGVFSENPRAIAFYRKAGFERIGEHQFFVGETAYVDWILARRSNTNAEP